jgi:hypothetical protein
VGQSVIEKKKRRKVEILKLWGNLILNEIIFIAPSPSLLYEIKCKLGLDL